MINPKMDQTCLGIGERSPEILPCLAKIQRGFDVGEVDIPVHVKDDQIQKEDRFLGGFPDSVSGLIIIDAEVGDLSKDEGGILY